MNEAVQFLSSQFNAPPKLAVVLGSGLAPLADELQGAHRVASKEIPGAKASSVEGHKGELVVGEFAGTRIACVSGRLHGYEGHSPAEVVYVVRALKAWGVEKFILTNAAGSTHRKFPAGSILCISDQINFTGLSPLRGLELFGGPRFPDSSDLYSSSWREKLQKECLKSSVDLPSGVYIGVNGPSFETAAEIRMFATWGADIVGMSTVWESLALKQMGAEILGLSLVSNFGTGVGTTALNHQEVLDIGRKSYPRFKQVLETAVHVGVSQ